jgi:hypothetical protein
MRQHCYRNRDRTFECGQISSLRCLREQGCGHAEWHGVSIVDEIRWYEKAGLRRDAVRSQVIDVLEAQEIKETGNEKG